MIVVKMAAPVRSLATILFPRFYSYIHRISHCNHVSLINSHKYARFPYLVRDVSRRISTSPCGLNNGEFEMQDPKSKADVVNIVYIDRDDIRHEVRGKVGDNLMYLAHRYDVDIEGACEASLACCTCHVVLPEEFYEKLPEPTEEEEDMLDLAPFLTATSRLSCQIELTKELEGMEIRLPQATRNFYVDGHVPEPH